METVLFIVALLLTLAYIAFNLGVSFWAIYKFNKTKQVNHLILFVCMAIYAKQPSSKTALDIAEWCGEIMRNYVGWV